MPRPSVKALGTVASGTGNITVNMPTHATNDIILVVCETANQALAANSTLTSNGFSLVNNLPTGIGTAASAGGTRLHVYWTRATSAAQSSVLIGDSGDHQIARSISFQDVITSGDPFQAPANLRITTANANAIFPAITTTNANTLIVHVIGHDRDSTAASLTAQTNATLANTYEHIDNATNSGAGGGIGVITGDFAGSGSTGNTTATIGAAVVHATWVAALLGTPDPVFKPWTQTIWL